MTIANNRGLGIIYGMMKDLIRVSLIYSAKIIIFAEYIFPNIQ